MLIKKILFLVSLSWRWVIILGVPLVMLFSMIGREWTQLAKGAFLLILMCVYWVTDCIPMYITSFIPLILAPAMGILTSTQICQAYLRDVIMLFFGAMIVALAVERTNLHKRLSLMMVRFFGVGQRSLLFGFMFPTWFLSMWIMNSATTAMMLTIVNSIIDNLEKIKQTRIQMISIANKIGREIEINCENKNEENLKEETEEEMIDVDSFSKALLLGIAYAASCGGITTLTGTSPNSVLKGIIVGRFGEIDCFTFGSWMGYAFPISLLLLLFTWLWLMVRFFGFKNTFKIDRKSSEFSKFAEKKLDEEYKKLGSIRYEEVMTLILFLLTALLWITRKTSSFGWSNLFPGKMSNNKVVECITDTQPVILIAFLFMILPAKNPIASIGDVLKKMRTGNIIQDDSDQMNHENQSKFLLPWETVHEKFPWGILFLLGGGFALSDCCTESNLSNYIGSSLQNLENLPPSLLVFVITLSGTFITSLTSNSATASLLIPIALDLSDKSKIHPFFITFPLAISISLAFLLPVSTPPNAIVYSSGRIRIIDMVSSGMMLNIVGASILTLCTLLYGGWMFNMDTIPEWAQLKS